MWTRSVNESIGERIDSTQLSVAESDVTENFLRFSPSIPPANNFFALSPVSSQTTRQSHFRTTSSPLPRFSLDDTRSVQSRSICRCQINLFALKASWHQYILYRPHLRTDWMNFFSSHHYSPELLLANNVVPYVLVPLKLLIVFHWITLTHGTSRALSFDGERKTRSVKNIKRVLCSEKQRH